MRTSTSRRHFGNIYHKMTYETERLLLHFYTFQQGNGDIQYLQIAKNSPRPPSPLFFGEWESILNWQERQKEQIVSCTQILLIIITTKQ